MRLIPVEFDALNCTILKAHRCNAFEFSPASSAKSLSQAGYLAYPTADRDNFDLFDGANDFKILGVWELHGGVKNATTAV